MVVPGPTDDLFLFFFFFFLQFLIKCLIQFNTMFVFFFFQGDIKQNRANPQIARANLGG